MIIEILLILIIVSIFVLIPFKPYWSLALLIALAPIENLIIQNFPSFGYFNLMKWSLLILVLFTIPTIIKRFKNIFVNKELLLYLAFIVWSFLSLLWAQEFYIAFVRSFLLLFLFIIYFMIIILPKRRDDILHLKLFVIFAIISLFTIPIIDYNIDRIAGGGLDQNEYAIIITIALTLALMWFKLEDKKWIKGFLLGFIPTGLIAVILTQSRSGLIITIPFFIYVGYSFLKGKIQAKKIFALAIILILVLTTLYFLPIPLIDRFKEASNDRLSGRIDIWIGGIKMFLANPILGVGSGNFVNRIKEYNPLLIESKSAHSTLLSIIGELGIIGFSIFILLLFTHFKRFWLFKIKQKNSKLKMISEGLFFAIVSYFIAILISGLWEYKVIFPLLLGSIMLITRKEK